VIRADYVHEPIESVSRERMFDPYFTAQDAGKGAELHLAAAFGVAVVHQGTVLVTGDSHSDTQISIYLPLVQAPAAQAPPA
jgi:signal transduction histidine kinase